MINLLPISKLLYRDLRVAIHGHRQGLVIGIRWQPCTKREPVDRQMSTFASDSTPRGWMVDGKRPAARFNARTRGSRRRRRRRKKWGRSVRGVHRIFAISVRVSILFSRRGSLRGTPALRPSLLFLFPSFCNVGNRILIRFSASLLSFLFFARDGLAGGDSPV